MKNNDKRTIINISNLTINNVYLSHNNSSEDFESTEKSVENISNKKNLRRIIWSLFSALCGIVFSELTQMIIDKLMN